MKLEASDVKQAAAGQWLSILADVAGISRDLLDGRHHGCPQCGGDDRFRLVDESAGSVLCNKCFAEANGDGLSAVQWMRGISFPESLRLVADYLGMATGTTRRTKQPPPLKFIAWNAKLATFFCSQKPPITTFALQRVDARMGIYRRNWTVVAIPVFAARPGEGEPVGWVMYHVAGGKLPVFGKGEERGKITEWVKLKNLTGSKPGVMGCN